MYLMSAQFFEKGGILFKGGHYIREDIIKGNTVVGFGICYVNQKFDVVLLIEICLRYILDKNPKKQ